MIPADRVDGEALQEAQKAPPQVKWFARCAAGQVLGYQLALVTRGQPKGLSHPNVTARRLRLNKLRLTSQRLTGGFRQVQPLRSHFSEDSSRFAIGRRLR
jgi:hypothetical protein